MRRMWIVPVAVLLLPAVAVLGGESLNTDLESLDLSVRRAAAQALSEDADPEALPELIRAVRREQDEETRRLLVVALGRIGDRRAIWDLFRRLDDPGGAALWSIRNILDGKLPCLPNDAGRLEALQAEWGERTRAWWKDWKNYGEFKPYSVLLPTPEQEVVSLRELRSPDERVALRAAERQDSDRLTLTELRIQASLLARHPHSWVLQALGRPLGTVDFPTLWTNLATSDLAVTDCRGRTHWALLPDCIPVLVSLLPKANPEWFLEFLGLLNWAARDTDRFRLDAARGFVYALARLEAEQEGTAPPRLSESQVELPGAGLPAAFVTLVRNRVRMKLEDKPEVGDPATWIPSLPWLRRWARELQPAKSDLPFLLEIACGAEDLIDRVWAVQALGRITDPEATKHLTGIAEDETDTALFAAAELVKDGKPDRFRELIKKKAGEEIARMLAFQVIPEDAIRLWIEKIVEPEREFGWVRGGFDPSAEEDVDRVASFGVRFREKDREALAALLPVEQISFETLVWFLTEVSASPLNGPAREKILDRLREYEVDEDDYYDLGNIAPLLALIEVRAPKKLVSLLHHWVEHREGAFREDALMLLGKLSDSRFVPEMIEVWQSREAYVGDVGWLSRVRDPRVPAFLERSAHTGSPDVRVQALVELFAYHGLPKWLACEFRDPAWIEYWIDRVDATCCIGFSALETLGELFPMLCVDEVGNRTEIKDLIVRWWQNHRNHLAFSRILDGWVSTR